MRKILSILVVLGISGILGTFINYSHEENIVATVQHVTEQQHVSGSTGENGGSVSTYYNYMVSTDKGVLEIKPSGIYASNSFGTLKEGQRYQFRIRGYSVPLIGIYPHIISATPI